MPPPQQRRSAGNQLDDAGSTSDIRKRRSLGSHGDKSPASTSGESSKPFRHKRVTHTSRAGPGQSPMSERQQMALLLQMTSTPDAELSPNSQSGYKPRERNERGETSLHIAAKKGDLDSAKKLLEQGSNPNVTDFAGWTPLHEAANHGHYHLAQLLIKHGANVMATGFDDVTPLHDAAMYGNQRLVELLIEKGADPLFKNKKGKAPYEVPHHSLVGFFNDLVEEMANKQQQKKSSSASSSSSAAAASAGSSGSGDLKKTTSGEVGEESNTMASSSSAPSDVYEFVSTPKHSSCSSGDEHPIGKNFDKSSDDKSGTDSDTPSTLAAASGAVTGSNVQQKRALGDQLDRSDDTPSPADEDSKRKKRKDSEFPTKEGAGGGVAGSSNKTAGSSHSSSVSSGQGAAAVANRVASRVGKPPGPASKTMGLVNKAGGQLDCKSESPKMAAAKSPAGETEADNDEMKEGPKVPPLKIVIPQQSSSALSSSSGGATATEAQDGSQNASQRTNKANVERARNATSGLPYVINSSTNENSSGSGEKEGAALASSAAVANVVLGSLLRSQSPSADSNKSTDDGKATCGGGGGKSKESRILRSSQRSGKDSKDDRSSNNSSPQLPVSSTPSPAAQNTDSSAGTESDHAQVATVATSQSTSLPSSTLTSATATSSGAQQTSTQQQPAQTAANSSQSNQQQQQQQQSTSGVASTSASAQAAAASSSSSSSSSQSGVELHPRKRKIKASSKEPQNSSSASSSSSSSSSSASSTADLKADGSGGNSKDGQSEKSGEPVHPHDQPFTNCYQMYIDLRKQIEQRHNNLHPIEPRPLKGLEDYLMNRRTYSLQGKTPLDPPNIIIPPLLPSSMKETFVEQEKERHRLKMKHIVEKEKLVLSKEQEILRVHCKAAQMIANQSQPFSVCTMLKDEEVYNIITPEQEEKYRNKNRERSHGRVFYQALKELDDKWDKIKEAMIIRHTNESESLHAVQKMDWGWKLKELALCEYKATPEIEELHVPMVDVSDEYTTPSTSD